MSILPTSILPRNILTALKRTPSQIRVSPLLVESAQSEAAVVFAKMQTGESGLSEEEADRRLEQHGPNVVAQEQKHPRLMLLYHACRNPLVILLLMLAGLSAYTEDYRAATVMLAMVVLGVVLRFVQEARADDAAAKLKAMISVTATVVRDGLAREVPLGSLVPGDVVAWRPAT